MNHKKATVYSLRIFLNSVLTLLRISIKKSQIKQKLNFINYPYLHKYLIQTNYIINVELLASQYSTILIINNPKYLSPIGFNPLSCFLEDWHA